MSQIADNPAKTELAPFEIWEVQLGNRTIKFFEPLVLAPFRLEGDPDDPDENEYLAVERPDLEIFANGGDRRQLWNCICGDIRSAWTHFVQAGVDRLSRHGKLIKDNYLRIAEEVASE